MRENVILSIRGSQMYEGQEPDVMELVTEGVWSCREDGRQTISYRETEITGLEGTTTSVHIQGSQVILERKGNVNSQMVFEVGCKHLSMYETPYGALSVGVETRRMKNTVHEGCGDLEIAYAIEIDNLMAGRSLFRMHVRKSPRLTQ